MFEDIMVDLETMGTSADAPIISIGAVAIDLQTGTLGDKFYAVVDLPSAVESGAVIDPATVLWWMQQSDDARVAFKVGMPIGDALHKFSRYVQRVSDHEQVKIWGNGAAFDNVILSASYKRVGLPQPWKFWNDRCYRTLKSLYPEVQLVREGTFHNALADAVSQANHLIAIEGVRNAAQEKHP